MAPSGSVSTDLGLRPGVFVGSSLPGTAVSTWLNRRAGPVGPGGVSANLVHWIDASALTGLSNGDPISTFTDLSASALHATAAGSARPTYVTGVQNGLPVARFDGTDDTMTTSAVPTAVTDNFTQFVLARLTTGDVDSVPVFNGVGATNGWGNALKEGVTNTKTGWLRGGIAWHASSVNESSTVRLLVGRRASGTFKLYHEGGANILSTASAPGAPTTSLRLGGHTSTASDLSPLDLSEALIYSAALSDADVNLVGAALCTKWGLTWTNLSS